MKSIMLAAASFAALMLAPSATAAERCNAATMGTWAAAGASVEAFASGVTCEKAFAVFVVRDESGTTQLYEATPLDFNKVLAGKTTPAEVEAALASWIDQSTSPFKTTADLPEWKAADELPQYGDYAFDLEAGIDRENYARIRKLAAPIFCYTSSLEHFSCSYKDSDSGGLIFKLGGTFLPS